MYILIIDISCDADSGTTYHGILVIRKDNIKYIKQYTTMFRKFKKLTILRKRV